MARHSLRGPDRTPPGTQATRTDTGRPYRGRDSVFGMATPEGRDGPVFPGFREMAERRRRLLGELVAHRQALGLSQTEVAARMRTSQSAVARLEAQAADVRVSTLERYAAALGRQIGWELTPAENAPVAARRASTGGARR